MDILVIENDPKARQELVALLKQAAFIAEGAADTIHGLHLLRRARHVPKLILLDIAGANLKRENEHFYQEKARDTRLASIPIVLLSLYTQIRERGAGLGAAEFIAKPVHPQALLEVVARYCQDM